MIGRSAWAAIGVAVLEWSTAISGTNVVAESGTVAEPSAIAEPGIESKPEGLAAPSKLDPLVSDRPTEGAADQSGESILPPEAAADIEGPRAQAPSPSNPAPRGRVRWRCLIADPECGVTFEVNAMTAFARRFVQHDAVEGGLDSWSSARVQYDFWANLPTLVETTGRTRYTKMTFGPKGGVAFSDGGEFWGNVGVAMRYWFGRGRFAPALEWTTALSFKLGRWPRGASSSPERSPVGVTADLGVGVGGFGAIVIGGQYDSPLAREDVPERLRVAAGGMVFVGFRGNILWGAPAACAVLTQGLVGRFVNGPM